MEYEKSGIIKKIIYYISILLILCVSYKIYKKYDYNGFLKAEYYHRESSFTRDKRIRFSDMSSYKLESKNFNDSMFYKEIEVKPNTPYKVTCMIKTENVQSQTTIDAGANICIVDSLESSINVNGTNDWKEVSLFFNSKNREKVKIGFRLGENGDNCKGVAWFSNFTIEEGSNYSDSNWNVACFIIKNLDINLQEGSENIKLSMRTNDISSMRTNMERYKLACKELSGNRMTVDYDIYEIDEPLTSISFSDEYGCYVNSTDVRSLLSQYLEKEEYDHIFVAVKLGDSTQNISMPIKDWIGLGGMTLYNIGFSNIRLPNENNSYIYTYNLYLNTFPEEVFLHEFLHSLERTLFEYGYDIPELHDNAKYGYKEENLVGLKNWYKDYMQCKVLNTSTNKYVGLNEIVYTLKPVSSKNFTYSIKSELNKEPENIIEEIKNMINVIKFVFSYRSYQ